MDNGRISLRGFQKSLFLTKRIVDKFSWRYFKLEDIFNFKKIYRELGDDVFVEILKLNEINEYFFKKHFAEEKNKVLYTSQEIIERWKSSLGEESPDEDGLSKLKTILDLFEIAKKTILDKEEKEEINSSLDYELLHDEKNFYIVLKEEIVNVFDKALFEPLSREVVKTYCKYFPYYLVSNNQWFYFYLTQL